MKNDASREDSITAFLRPVAPDSICEIGYRDWTGKQLMGDLCRDTLTHRLSVINGYSAILSDACLLHVLTDPNVEYVEVCTLARRPIPARAHKIVGGQHRYY